MKIKISAILLGLAAEAILAVIFFSLIPSYLLQEDTRWLDFVVMTVINLIFVLNVLFPLVKFDDKSHKEIAGLGIRWSATGWYSALAVLMILGDIFYTWQTGYYAMSFKLQAVIQSVLLLFFLIGISASVKSMEKAREVYALETTLKKGKKDIKAAVASMLAAAEDNPQVPAEITERIRHIASETRYITPSTSHEAENLDKDILDACERIQIAMSDYKINREMITNGLSKIEIYLKRRRNLLN